MQHLNDNVFQGIEYGVRTGAKLYRNKNGTADGVDSKSKIPFKDPLQVDEKAEIAEEFLESHAIEEQRKMLCKNRDKILVTHRNSKLFLFMLTGPFFLCFMLLKYTLKTIILIYLWRRRKQIKSATA